MPDALEGKVVGLDFEKKKLFKKQLFSHFVFLYM